MKETPLISVIVPVYNVKKWLNRCVESICTQTYHNLDIILVDDGSTDGSGELCDVIGKKDMRIKVVHKTNGGLSDARNVGLQHATGEYVSFIDSDDWIEKDFYQFLIQTMLKDNCDIVGCKYRKCIEGAKQEDVATNFEKKSYMKMNAMKALIENEVQQVVWNKLYKYSLIEGIFFEKGKYHEDEFWSYQVFGCIDKYTEISYVGYNYFQRADSIMGENYSLKRLDVIEAKMCRQVYLEEFMPKLATVGRLNLNFSCLYHGQLALQQLEKPECRYALRYLKDAINANRLRKGDLEEESFTHCIWLKLSQNFFVLTCKVRNLFGIGM